MSHSRPFSFIFGFSNKFYNFYDKFVRKNAHPVHGAGVQTNNLQNMSLLTLPLDQGFSPFKTFLSHHSLYISKTVKAFLVLLGLSHQGTGTSYLN